LLVALWEYIEDAGTYEYHIYAHLLGYGTQAFKVKFADQFAGRLLTVAQACFSLPSQPYCSGGEITAKNK
jgi:hypothetical protein